MKKQTIVAKAFQLHRSLMWIAIFGLAAFLVSALLHPIMVWTGPQSIQYRPPSFSLNQPLVGSSTPLTAQQSQRRIERALQQLSDLSNTGEAQADLSQTKSVQRLSPIEEAEIEVAKLVPTEVGPMLQVTTGDKSPRQYFSLDQQQSRYSDEQQALWLAAYYSGEQRSVDSVTFVDEFSREYPAVNRLLPVYKVVYEGDDNLSIFVHTETNALASMNNDWKRALQTGFQWMHTWSWLDGFPVLRAIALTVLLLVLLTMSIAGLMLLVLFKRRLARRRSLIWHRAIAWAVWFPLTALLVSGLYHLLHNAWNEPQEEARMLARAPFAAPSKTSPDPLLESSGLSELQAQPIARSLYGQTINSLSLVRFGERWLLRASVAGDQKGEATSLASVTEPIDSQSSKPDSEREIRQRRFDGRASEQGAAFYTLQGHHLDNLSDTLLVSHWARQWLALPDQQVMALSLVTRFGPDYDFRYKRLPVWRVDVNNAQSDRLFIDPVSGLLIDHQQAHNQWEPWSFSILHKWNPLVLLMGREGRDLLVVVVLLAIGMLGWLGFRMRSGARISR